MPPALAVAATAAIAASDYITASLLLLPCAVLVLVVIAIVLPPAIAVVAVVAVVAVLTALYGDRIAEIAASLYLQLRAGCVRALEARSTHYNSSQWLQPDDEQKGYDTEQFRTELLPFCIKPALYSATPPQAHSSSRSSGAAARIVSTSKPRLTAPEPAPCQ
eukprot:7603-Heterococcus_DN1.PRE.2